VNWGNDELLDLSEGGIPEIWYSDFVCKNYSIAKIAFRDYHADDHVIKFQNFTVLLWRGRIWKCRGIIIVYVAVGWRAAGGAYCVCLLHTCRSVLAGTSEPARGAHGGIAGGSGSTAWAVAFCLSVQGRRLWLSRPHSWTRACRIISALNNIISYITIIKTGQNIEFTNKIRFAANG
jgi:hypothetical protein